MLARSFRGHGTFFYLARESLAKFAGDGDKLASAVKAADMQHAWVRLHDHEMKMEPEQPTTQLVDALVKANIAVAGWGFVRGENPLAEAKAAAGFMKKFNLQHYVADIEQDEHDSRWTKAGIATFLMELRKALPAGAQVLVSSYPYIRVKHPELMKAAAPHADGFAPQIYWVNHPQPYMLVKSALPPNPSRQYDAVKDLHDPLAYADLCLDWWRATVGSGKPLIMTGQAYWESGFARSDAEAKLDLFLAGYSRWQSIAGINWWHFGHQKNLAGNGAMTQSMLASIGKAKLAGKPFQVV